MAALVLFFIFPLFSPGKSVIKFVFPLPLTDKAVQIKERLESWDKPFTTERGAYNGKFLIIYVKPLSKKEKTCNCFKALANYIYLLV